MIISFRALDCDLGRMRTAALSLSAALISGMMVMIGTAALTPAAAQSDLSNLVFRLERIERDLGALSAQVYGGSGQTGGAPVGLTSQQSGQIQVRLTELESLLQQLTGQVEQALFESQDLKRRFELFAQDTEQRLIALESGQPVTTQSGSSIPAAGTPPPSAAPAGTTGSQTGILGYLPGGAAPGTTAAPQSAMLTGTPAEQYNYAFSLLRRADYVAAEAAFRSFIDTHPDNRLAGNAQYWLGETYYIRRDYQSAAATFLEGYKSYPNNDKAPDNLLKLGLSMAAINKREEACAAFGRLSSQFPSAPEPIKRRARTEMGGLGC